MKEERPEMIIGVMGCMAQNHKDLIFKRAPHVDLVVGTSRFEDVAELLQEVKHGERVMALDRKDLSFDRDIQVRARRHQAFITAMRGCNKFCTFCIVPFTQGRERSRPMDDLVAEAKRLADDGVVEITVIGQRIDTYGLDLKNGTNLAKLLARLHEEVPSLLRLTYITSHPNHMTEELARTVGDHQKIARYLHLPVQSGSDRVLLAMNRGYTVDEYRRAVDTMRAHIDGLSLATDWIVGYPGETEEEFELSMKLQAEIGYQTSFIFKYSPRAGTRAFELGDPVPRVDKERRNQLLLAAQHEISLQRNNEQLGKTVQVLVEGPSKRDPNKQMGRTDRNLIVCFPSNRDQSGKLARVRINECTALTLLGDQV
jgi:tRNA-2-methylthio-N6-dimethylallyladenosine synthase